MAGPDAVIDLGWAHMDAHHDGCVGQMASWLIGVGRSRVPATCWGEQLGWRSVRTTSQGRLFTSSLVTARAVNLRLWEACWAVSEP